MKNPLPPAPPAKPLKDAAHCWLLNRERIAADIAAFEKDGGLIQVLGTTRWHDGRKTTGTLADERDATANADVAGGG